MWPDKVEDFVRCEKIWRAPLLHHALCEYATCWSVNMPPALFAKGGISLPGTPFAMIWRGWSSPATAR